jgi:hypothetical protein
MREVLELLALALIGHDLGIRGHVGDAVVRAGDERAVARPLVQHAIEPVRLLDVAVDGVGNFLGRILAEMVVLPVVLSDSRSRGHVLEEQFV